MKVLFDTNVIIDAFTMRDYDYKNSRDLLIKATNKDINGYLSAKQITDIYYILRKYINDEQIKKNIISDLCSIFTVLPILPGDIKASLNTKINDFEDAIIEETAKVNMVQYIVTNDIKHFKDSNLVIVTPAELVTLLNAKS